MTTMTRASVTAAAADCPRSTVSSLRHSGRKIAAITAAQKIGKKKDFSSNKKSSVTPTSNPINTISRFFAFRSFMSACLARRARPRRILFLQSYPR